MYLYEMHQHTASCSACAKGDPVKTVRALSAAGFSGTVLTNHFLHGNTCIDRSLPWKDFVRFYEEDYLTAKEEGDRIGFDVLFGIEEHVGGGKEVLLYGITPDFLYRHPELSSGRLEDITPAVREEGGVVIQAHPFRDREYIRHPLAILPPELLDGFEAFNANNRPENDKRALDYASRRGFPITAGSDAHTEMQEVRFGILTHERMKTAEDLAGVLKSGRYELYLGTAAENPFF